MKDEIIEAMESRINETKQRIEEQKLEMLQIDQEAPRGKRHSRKDSTKTTPEFTSSNSAQRKSKHNSVEGREKPLNNEDPVSINTIVAGKHTKKQA
jgi:hypothetical protein